ncbi:MAG: hypothetical protein FWD13_02820 [Treponema sp.]|nr:hypothetical protein [Treponema sp.]
MKNRLLVVVLIGFIFALILCACKNPFWNIEEEVIEKDLHDTIEFLNKSSVITKTYGDPVFTNAVADTYQGSGSVYIQAVMKVSLS